MKHFPVRLYQAAVSLAALAYFAQALVRDPGLVAHEPGVGREAHPDDVGRRPRGLCHHAADHADTMKRWAGRLQEASGSNIWSCSTKFLAYAQ